MTMDVVNLAELETLALERLSAMARDYYVSGANDEHTLRANRASFEALTLHYRVLVDVSRRALATTVLGTPVAMPVLLAPSAFQRLAHREGELAAVRAAKQAGLLLVLSTLASTSLEDVAVEAGDTPLWYQLYVFRDRGVTRALVERAETSGYRALVLTVDAPLFGRRERDVRNEFRLPPDVRVANLEPHGLAALPDASGDSGLAAYVAQMLDPSLTWKDVEWLRSMTKLPVVLKGIVRPDDAARAAEHGAAAVVVSNHGGRQLDTAPATIDVLPAIAERVDGRLELYLDGGVRRGTDVIKALALGARAVLLGRPVLWGLAVGGEAGVSKMLALLRTEIDLAMALCGCASVADVTRDLVGTRPDVRR